MTLRVTTLPNPAVGKDWSTLVPGNELWDVTGIVATLKTAVAGPPSFATVDAAILAVSPTGYYPLNDAANPMTDHSGHGNNGTYDPDATGHVTLGGAPIFAGATSAAITTGTPGYIGKANMVAGLMAGDWWVAMSYQRGADDTGRAYVFFETAVGNIGLIIFGSTEAGDATSQAWRGTAVGSFEATFSPVIPNGAVDCMTVVVYHAGTGVYDWYNNGVLVGSVADSGAATVASPTIAHIGQYGDTATRRFGPVAWGTGALTAAQVAAMYPPTSGGTGRTPSLVVTDGTHVLQTIGQGFAAPATAGPYAYSWQPGVSSNTATPAGTTISIAIPKLIVPAGYVLETVTPDLIGTDQWSNLAVWWSTDIMDALGEVSPYAYPPGAFLEYRQQGT